MGSSRTFTTTFLGLEPDVRLRIVQSGPDQSSTPGPALLFLHFAGGSADTWSQAANFVPPNLPTAALDFRGWGQSTGPARSEAYHILDLAKDVEAVIDGLGLRRVVLVGHSMGGKVAMALAGRQTVRRQGLLPSLASSVVVGGGGGSSSHQVIIGLVLIGPASPLPMALSPAMAEQQVQAYRDPLAAEFVARNVLTSSGAKLGSNKEEEEEAYAGIAAGLLRNNRWASEAWPMVAMKDDVVVLARQIEVPVVVVAGEKDVVEPVEKMEREVVSNMPGARLVVLEDCGHLVSVEKPERLAEVVMELVKELAN